MIVNKYGRVAGSIDLATLAQMYAQTSDAELKVHYRQVAAENGLDLSEPDVGHVEVATERGDGVHRAMCGAGGPMPVEVATERGDGVHGVGGPWYEVVVGGEVVDKVRGAGAAKEAYETYLEVDGGDN